MCLKDTCQYNDQLKIRKQVKKVLNRIKKKILLLSHPLHVEINTKIVISAQGFFF